MTLRRGDATRLTIYLHADAHVRYRSVSKEIIRRAHDAGLSGASRFPGLEGFGRSRVIHNDVDPDIMRDLPCMIEIVDPSEERIRAFAARLGDVLDHGLVIIESLEIAGVFSDTADGRIA